MRIAIVGSSGQLGADLAVMARQAGHAVHALTHADIELTVPARVNEVIGALAPDVIINAAAMNHVERCESEPELAYAVNALGPRNLALAAAAPGAVLLHVSTDYVFDGRKGAPYVETDLPAPLNAYGTAKLAGEHFVRALAPRSFVVRTSALYGANPCRAKPQDNFVRFILRQAREKGKVTVVRDQWVSPTWTHDLSKQILRLLDSDAYGTYHATSQGSCSWAEFADAIVATAGLEATVDQVTSEAYASPVQRPASSVLDNEALRRRGMDMMPHWRESLRRYVESLREPQAAVAQG